MDWQPIETAPKFTELLLWDPVVGVVSTGEWYENEGWLMTFDEIPFEPTHWMPMPAPPQSVVSGAETGAD
jgi:hypothetical protein